MDILYHIVICIDAFVSFSYMCNTLQHLTDLLRTMDEKRVQCFPCNLISTFTLLGMFSLSHWGKALKRPCQNPVSAAYHDFHIWVVGWLAMLGELQPSVTFHSQVKEANACISFGIPFLQLPSVCQGKPKGMQKVARLYIVSLPP